MGKNLDSLVHLGQPRIGVMGNNIMWASCMVDVLVY